jgi:PD-(D/E)XK nuclease superfamily
MSSVTTSFDGSSYKPKSKPFSWSYTKMKNFEACPKRHYNVDIVKSYKEEEGESLLWGNAVHKALSARCGKGEPLPKSMQIYEKWAERVTSGGNVLVEQQMAIDTNLSATDWFDSDAKKNGHPLPWYRGVADVLKIAGPVALAIDWKTGKVLDDAPQLALMAACIFAHHPDVQKIRTEFVWLKEDASTRQDFRREDMAAFWRSIHPRVEALENAHKTSDYPPKPGHLCRSYCPVRSCAHCGKG